MVHLRGITAVTTKLHMAGSSGRAGWANPIFEPEIFFFYSNSLQESFYLLYGWDARLPTATVLDTPPSPYTVDLDDIQGGVDLGDWRRHRKLQGQRSARHRFSRKKL